MENPRELIFGPTKQWPTRSEERVSLLKDASTFVHDNGKYFVQEIRHGYHFLLAWIKISEHTNESSTLYVGKFVSI